MKMQSRRRGIYRPNNYRGATHGNNGADMRKQLGEKLEPYGRFDTDIERFCCRTCGWQSEKYQAMCFHLEEHFK